MQLSILFPLVFRFSMAQLAPLELPDGSPILFGTWWDRLNGQTPALINQKFGRSLSLWQCDVNITDTLQSAAVDQIFQQIKDTNTTALVYLTVYPNLGFESVSDSAINELAQKVQNLTNQGSKLFLRYASEMNGAWFMYGQQPTAFIASWKKVVSAVRAAAGPNNVAFIWAPNSANGYPYLKSTHSVTVNSSKWDPSLDTNGDGKFDKLDDPFSSFYPGDEWVDWVGMSLYHYGDRFPWTRNTVPIPGEAERIILGTSNGQTPFNFYRMFCGDGFGGKPFSQSQGGKPMIITETAATIHVAGIVINPRGTPNFVPVNQCPECRAQIKQTWWRQIINATFLEEYPKIKAVSFFEFFKFEETTWRDFTIFGGDGNLTSPENDDGAAMNNLTLIALQRDMNGDMGRLVQWAQPGSFGTIYGSATRNVTGSTPPNSQNPQNSAILSFNYPLLLMLALCFIF